MTQIDLKDKVALVTGASRGIGRAIALDLAAHGAKVVVNYNASEDAANALVEQIKGMGGSAVAIKANVAEFAQAQALVEASVKHFERVDILVNNAGTTRDGLLMTMKEDAWDQIIDLNLKSVYSCSKAVIRAMLRNQWGRIINVSSVVGIGGNPGQTNYAASKAGMIGFTKALAKEVGKKSITVNCVAPGYIPTDVNASLSPELVAMAINATPLNRPGTTQDVANMVSFLASDLAAFITGAVIPIDGGMSM